MNILLACHQSPHDYAIPAYRFWHTYFCEGLREAGHTVLEVPDADWARGLLALAPDELRAWQADTWSRALDTARAARAAGGLDLFLGYFYPQQIDGGALRAIRDLGVPCVNFFCDNVREFRAVPAAYHEFDLHWVPEFAALELYRRAGLPHIHAPMPVWVEPRHRTCEHAERHGPTFLGSSDSTRLTLLADAVARGADVTVRGPAWASAEPSAAPPPAPLARRLAAQWKFLRDQGAAALLRRHFSRSPTPKPFPRERVATPVWGDDYIAMTQQSSVVIGINRFPSFRHPANRPAAYSRLRDIEAPMLGACYLTEWAPGLDRLYEPGNEIETYRDAAELAEKLRALQADAPRRRRLRAAGQRRALAEHTIPRTIRQIAEHLGCTA